MTAKSILLNTVFPKGNGWFFPAFIFFLGGILIISITIPSSLDVIEDRNGPADNVLIDLAGLLWFTAFRLVEISFMWISISAVLDVARVAVPNHPVWRE